VVSCIAVCGEINIKSGKKAQYEAGVYPRFLLNVDKHKLGFDCTENTNTFDTETE
jgi:hypothetical protein